MLDLPWWLWPALFLFSSGAALALWANKLLLARTDKQNKADAKQFLLEKLSRQTVTTSPPTLRGGLYVCDIRFTFARLEDRHSELTMCVFNGTGRVVEFYHLQGQMTFNAPNNADPGRMGTLPTPALRPDTARTVAPFKEWSLILNQHVPGTEANKLLAMIENDIPIHFDLRELQIQVVGQHDRNKVERLPIWDGVSYSRSRGFGKTTHHFSMLGGDRFRDKDFSGPPDSAS